MKKLITLAIASLFLVSLTGLALACDGAAKAAKTAKAGASCCQQQTSLAGAAPSSCSKSAQTAAALTCSKGDQTAEAGLPVDVAWAELENGVVLYYSTSCNYTQSKLEEMASGGEFCCPFAEKVSKLADAKITFGVGQGGVFAIVTSSDPEEIALIKGEIASYAADD